MRWYPTMEPRYGGVIRRLLDDGEVEGRREEVTSGLYQSMAKNSPAGRAPEVVRVAGGTKYCHWAIEVIRPVLGE